MSNEVTKKSEMQLDGFSAGYSEPARTGDDAGGSSGGASFGIKLKFTKEARWVDPDDNDVKGPLLAIDVVNRVHKWPGDGGGPLETITLKPGEDWPDIHALNEACRDEWFEKFGKMVGPWAGEHVVLFVDYPTTMTAYWWPSPTATIGACVAVCTLIKQTKLMRQLKQQQVHPLVEPTHTFMNTAYGGHERPMLKVINWVVLGGSGGGVLPPTNSPPLVDGTSNPVPSASSPVQSGAPLAMQIVTPPTLKEELADEIPF